MRLLTQNWSKLEKQRMRCDIVKLPKALRDLLVWYRENRKLRWKRQTRSSVLTSHKLNVKPTTFKEKFTSWQLLCQGRMALARPFPALLTVEMPQGASALP